MVLEKIMQKEGSNMEGTQGWGGRGEDRLRRLEVPYFTGEDPYGWIYRSERYSHVNRVSEAERVTAAAICLEGRALNWFQWWEARTQRIS